MRRRAGVVASVLMPGAAVAALHLAGGALPSPPLGAPGGWSDWLRGRDPVVVAFSAARLLALGFAWYAVIVTAAGTIARLVSATRLTAGLDRLTLPALRRLLAATMSVGVGAASMAPRATLPVAAVAAAQPSTTTTAPPADSLTMRELPPVDEVPLPDPPGERTWTVRPGECFWSIAEDVVASRLGRQPTAAETVPFWRRLIDANRPALADRDNPDLVFPGQVFTVPDPP